MYNPKSVSAWITAATLSMQSDTPIEQPADLDASPASRTIRLTDERTNVNPSSDCSDDGFSDDETNDFMARHGVNRQPNDQIFSPNHQTSKHHLKHETNHNSVSSTFDTSNHITASLCVDACDSGLQSRSLIDASFYELLNHMPQSNKMPHRRLNQSVNHAKQSHVKFPSHHISGTSSKRTSANSSPRNHIRTIQCTTYDRQNGDDYYDRDDGCDCRYCSYFNQDASTNQSTIQSKDRHHRRPQEYHPTSDQPINQPFSGGPMDDNNNDVYPDNDTQSIISTDSERFRRTEDRSMMSTDSDQSSGSD